MGKQIKTLLEDGRNRAQYIPQDIEHDFLSRRRSSITESTERCPKCGTYLNDSGSCPACDHGDGDTGTKRDYTKISDRKLEKLRDSHPHADRYEKKQPTLFDESFLYDPEDETLQESLSSEEKQVISISTKNQYAGADRNTILYQIAILKDKLKKEKDRQERNRIKHQIAVLKQLLISSKKLDKKLKIK